MIILPVHLERFIINNLPPYCRLNILPVYPSVLVSKQTSSPAPASYPHLAPPSMSIVDGLLL
eukprot:scaffold3388_cov114-Skeletonema_marinoi.AAC.2